MPVVPRNFCFHMTPSLYKSVECESLSLYWGEEGRASSATVCILAEHGGLEHYRMSIVRPHIGPSGLHLLCLQSQRCLPH